VDLKSEVERGAAAQEKPPLFRRYFGENDLFSLGLHFAALVFEPAQQDLWKRLRDGSCSILPPG